MAGAKLPRSGLGFRGWSKGSAAWPYISAPLLIVLVALLALRCWLASRVDFETDEAYYWLWSRHLAESYFDHPPMVAYFIRAGTFLFGDTIFGIRSMAILAMLLASGLLYLLACILFDDRRVAELSVLWFSVTPHTAFFSLVMYPDSPAILFSVMVSVGLALVWRPGRGGWWYLVGVALGLLLLSKYTGVFVLFGVVIWLVASEQMRCWLRRREPYAAGLLALLIFSPVIYWNYQHGWASFIKQFGRALDHSPHGGFTNVATFLGVQAAFVSPLIFVFAAAGLSRAVWYGLRWQKPNWLILASVSAPILLYFAFHALSAEVLPQWPSAAYPACILAAVAAFSRWAGPGRQWFKQFSFQAAPWLGLTFTLALYAQLTIRPISVLAAEDPLNRFAGWSGLAEQTRKLAQVHHANYVATDDYGTNATLAFYLRDLTVFQTSEAIRYVFQAPIDQALLAHGIGIYLASQTDNISQLQEHFDDVEFIGTVWRNRDGDPIEPYRVYELQGYRGGVPF